MIKKECGIHQKMTLAKMIAEKNGKIMYCK